MPELTEIKTGETPDARSLVYTRLSRQLLRYPDLAIEPLETPELSPREQAFARALEIAALTRWRTLETIIASRLQRPWPELEPRVRGALMGGAAQLLFMDRIPDHAAVAETVAWAKKRIRPGAGGLINGVLRAITRLRSELLPVDDERSRNWWDHRDIIPLESGESLLLEEPVFTENPAIRLGQQSSLGDSLLLGWIGAQGWICTRQRAHHCLARPPIHLHQGTDECTVWEGSHAELVALLQSDPTARVQDRGSARVIESTRSLSPKVIVDFCAGRGTKTKQLALLHPDAQIFATDVNEVRMSVLRKVFEGHPSVRAVEPGDLREVMGAVDLLVLDVPCSNTGVLPRRPQARYRFNDDSRDSLSRLQKRIVTETVSLLAPGANLLYSTCSLETGENDKIAKWIEDRYEVETITKLMVEPRGVPGDPAEAYADGGFHAIFAGKAGKEAPAAE